MGIIAYNVDTFCYIVRWDVFCLAISILGHKQVKQIVCRNFYLPLYNYNVRESVLVSLLPSLSAAATTGSMSQTRIVPSPEPEYSLLFTMTIEFTGCLWPLNL
jgi:hypothetical protein